MEPKQVTISKPSQWTRLDDVDHHLYIGTYPYPPGLFRASSLSKSFNFPRYTTFDPVIIIPFNMFKSSQPTLITKLTGSNLHTNSTLIDNNT